MKILIAVFVLAFISLGVVLYFSDVFKGEPLTELPPVAEDVTENWLIDAGSIALPVYGRSKNVKGFKEVTIQLVLRGDYDQDFLNPYLPVILDKLLRENYGKNKALPSEDFTLRYKKIAARTQKTIDDMFLPGLVLEVKVSSF